MFAVPGRHVGLILAVYLAASVAVTWPLAFHLSDRLGAPVGPGDPYLNLWILGWGLQAWTNNPAGVLSGAVFDANIFHPAQGTLAYSDHFLLQALALSPVYAITRDAVLCYNLLLIASIAASGLAMHVLARSLTGSVVGAFAAGIAWSCWPYRTAHLLHIQLQALYFMPLALLCLHRVVAGRRWRDALALGVMVALQAVASVYYGVMTAWLVVMSSIVLAITTGQWRATRLWSKLAFAMLVAGLLSAPFLLPYARTQQSEGFGRTLFEAANHSASWHSYSQVGAENLVYGRTGLLDPSPPAPGERDRGGVEHRLFPGVVLVGLGIAGLVRNIRRDSRSLVLSAVTLMVVGTLLSFGPEGVRTIYAWLHDNVFGFQAIRAPARFAVVAMCGLALLAALGLRSIKSRSLTIGLVALLAMEYLHAPLPLVAAPPRQTAVGQWLASEPAAGAVLHLPLYDDSENTAAMVQSLEHRRPIVNGYSGQRPAFFSAIVESIADFPSPSALATLRELDVRFVVSPATVAGVGDPRSPLVERARFSEGVVYEVRWTSDAIAALGDTSGPPPPPPGPIPFAAGETAVYDVYWDSGPVDLPAGSATISVLADARTSGQWKFEARAETAGWMESFFAAQDQFVTTADVNLLPLEHNRDINEGRRRLQRTYVYRREERHVRMGDSSESAVSGGALTLPLGSEQARDALTAWFYVRTLPLTPGSIVSVPINEAGASLVLQVATAEEEAIEQGGEMVRALRIEPRLMRRIERRRPVSMTLWLSADARRLPLRAIIDAGFGRVRADLASYRH